MIDKYIYLVLGIVLGLAIGIYFWASREERIEKQIKDNQKVFSTYKLDRTMETIVDKIRSKRTSVKRDLTEEEKNDIIEGCLKQNFISNK